jgi:hypothetical protein
VVSDKAVEHARYLTIARERSSQQPSRSRPALMMLVAMHTSPTRNSREQLAISDGEIARRHLRVCARFSDAVGAADGHWRQPSPCAKWDARGVLEHVIGFHDVLMLRPLAVKPDRPRETRRGDRPLPTTRSG